MTLDRRSLLLSMGAIAALRAISAFPKSKNPAQPQAAASTAGAAANRLLSDRRFNADSLALLAVSASQLPRPRRPSFRTSSSASAWRAP